VSALASRDNAGDKPTAAIDAVAAQAFTVMMDSFSCRLDCMTPWIAAQLVHCKSSVRANFVRNQDICPSH
jgi:hypothetical protein